LKKEGKEKKAKQGSAKLIETVLKAMLGLVIVGGEKKD